MAAFVFRRSIDCLRWTNYLLRTCMALEGLLRFYLELNWIACGQRNAAWSKCLNCCYLVALFFLKFELKCGQWVSSTDIAQVAVTQCGQLVVNGAKNMEIDFKIKDCETFVPINGLQISNHQKWRNRSKSLITHFFFKWLSFEYSY